MSANAHDGIIGAMIAALQAAPAVTAGTIAEDIDAATMPEDETERVVVVMAQSVGDRGAILGNPVDWRTDIDLQCTARADGRVAGVRASRALHARCYARIMSDPTLGDAAMDVLGPTLHTENLFADTRVGTTVGTYTVLHRTSAASLES